MKYYILDSNGYYLGLALDEPKGWEYWTNKPPTGNFLKHRFDGENWIEGATPEEILESHVVPEQVPLWALKATLDLENKLGAVEAALDQLPEIVKKKAYWIWEYGNFIHRNSQTVGFIGQVLGMNKTEIDTLFINAENIEL
jgi:hypothetical protein